MLIKQKREELQKKWNDTCLQLHPNYPRTVGPQRITPTALSMTGLGLYNPKLLARQPFQPKVQQSRNLGNPLLLNAHQTLTQPFQPKPLQLYPYQVSDQSSPLASSPPRSPVRTDLVLGPTKVTEHNPEKKNEEPVVKDFLGCISSEPQAKFNQLLNDKFADALDADSFKKLLKGLMEKAWWQPEAASAVATTVTQCKLGHGKQRTAGSKGNIWLLFTGPDRVGKKKMASVLSEHVCGANPVMICLGSRRDDEEFDQGFRGKTALDRIAEAVRRNPFSVILLEDIDEADMLVRGSIKRAMERGRLTDSHGREISLGNVIFILTGNWSTGNLKVVGHGCSLDENKLASVATRGWQLRLTTVEKCGKRRGSWLLDADRQTRARKELGTGLSLDLNQAADMVDDSRTNGSNGSNIASDLTNDRDDDFGLDEKETYIASVPHELVNSVDAAIVFKPANFGHICREVDKTITKTSCNVVDEKLCVEVEEEVLQKIVAGIWFGRTSLQEWAERVAVPAFQQLKAHYSSEQGMSFRLESHSAKEIVSDEDWLPSKITVMVEE